MKYQKGQEVMLLATDGKPAAGQAIILDVDLGKQAYTVAHYLNNAEKPDIIENVPEGRLVLAGDLVNSLFRRE